MDEATDVGPLATAAGRDDLAELVDDAVAKGAEVLTGGGAPEGPAGSTRRLCWPGSPMTCELVMEEAFGPVASLYRVADRDEAARVANQTAFGLSSAVEQRSGRTGLVHQSPRCRRGVPERDDRVLSGVAVRRGQGLRLRTRAGRCGHPRILQPQDGLEGLSGQYTAGGEEAVSDVGRRGTWPAQGTLRRAQHAVDRRRGTDRNRSHRTMYAHHRDGIVVDLVTLWKTLARVCRWPPWSPPRRSRSPRQDSCSSPPTCRIPSRLPSP